MSANDSDRKTLGFQITVNIFIKYGTLKRVLGKENETTTSC